MLKLYTDKHIPKTVTTQLRRRGVDIIRCEDVGLGDAADWEHLEYAAHEGRVMITKDFDFVRLTNQLRAQGKSHPGILLCLFRIRDEYAIGRIVNEVMMYHELIEGGAGTVETDVANRIIYVN